MVDYLADVAQLVVLYLMPLVPTNDTIENAARELINERKFPVVGLSKVILYFWVLEVQFQKIIK